MLFCPKCDSILKKTAKGVVCSKCEYIVRKKIAPLKKQKKGATAIFVIENSSQNSMIGSYTCPKCGHEKAIHWFARLSGDHAGVSVDRTVEHFECVSCLHRWNKKS